MRTAMISTALCLAGGCAAESLEARDTASDDVVDVVAKLDAQRPVGIYEVIDPDSFEEGFPRMVHLDLRRDDTFYIYEIGASLDDEYGKWSEGYNSYFGTYTLNKDRYGNRYLRVKDDDGDSWRYKYKVVNGELCFFYRSGEVGWRMRRLDDPSAAHLARIREVFEAGTNRRRANDRAGIHPDSVWSRFYDLRDTGDYGVYSLNVDGTVHYMVLGEGMVEIYARNNQLLAAALDGETWEWTEDLF